MAKRIGAIVSLSIIGVLILATIIMANVNVNYSVRCANPAIVYVNYNGGSVRDAENFNGTDKIIEYINNASKEKALTAMFNGTLGKKAEIKVVKERTMPSNSGFNVRYHYGSKQKLMDGKEVYKNSNGDTVYYEELVFTVNNVEGINVVNVYVIQDATKSTTYSYYYELEANFASLYNYLDTQING